MDFIKKNLYTVVVAGITLVCTVVLLALTWTSTQKVHELDTRVKDIQASEDKFLQLKYRLDARNVKIAQDGAKLAEASHQDFLNRLVTRFNVINPVVEESASGLAFKTDLLRRLESINQSLKVNNISGNLGTMGFDYYNQPEVTPTPAQMRAILKQFTIHEELIEILSQAQVRTLSNLKLRGQEGNIKAPTGLKMAEKPRFKYFEYDLDVSGDVDTMQRLLAGLYNSRYCFAVRFLAIEGSDAIPNGNAARSATSSGAGAYTPGEAAGGPSGPGGPGGLPAPRPAAVVARPATESAATQRTKDERLVVTGMNTLRMAMVIDYIEFKAE